MLVARMVRIYRIYRIDIDDPTIDEYASTGSLNLGLAHDASGNVYTIL